MTLADELIIKQEVDATETVRWRRSKETIPFWDTRTSTRVALSYSIPHNKKTAGALGPFKRYTATQLQVFSDDLVN